MKTSTSWDLSNRKCWVGGILLSVDRRAGRYCRSKRASPERPFFIGKGGSFAELTAPKHGYATYPKNGDLMLLPVVFLLKEIYEKGRDYLWPRPELCPRCKVRRPWGHGFVLANFDGYPSCLLLRRYRCPCCGCVIRLKPQGYFERFQSPIETIRAVIHSLVEKIPSRSGGSRTRKAHWLKALERNAMAYLGEPFRDNLLAAFDRLIEMGKIPVSRSTQL